MHIRGIKTISLFWLALVFSVIDLNAQDVNSIIISGVNAKTLLESYLQQECSGSGCRFFYSEKLLTDVFILPSDNDKSLTDFLDQVLISKGISYIVYKDRNLIFIEKNRLSLIDQARYAKVDEKGNYYYSVDIGDPMLAGKYKKAVLTGYIRSGKTGEPLPGARVYIARQDLGVVTDHNGFYSIELPVGKHDLTYSYVSFEEKEFEVNMISPGNFDVEIFESTIAIDQVIVTANSEANVVSTEMSIVRLDAKTISGIPVLLGEPDIMKAMTLLPGIQSSGDMASGFNVRGGSTDQNLILIDDVPIFNANHLFGMFSIIDTRTIDNLELFKGGAPSRYGGRASSFMNIDLKEGNMKEFEGNGDIGLFSSKLSLQGPIVKDKASIIIGGRKTYSDWILKRIPDVDIRNSEADFYDFNAKLNFVLNQNNRISLFGYVSNDFFGLAGKNLFEYSNKLGAIKWNHIFNNKLTLSFSAGISDYSTNTIDKENAILATSVKSGIRQKTSKIRMLYDAGAKHDFEAGIEGNYYTFFNGEQKPYGEESTQEEVALENEQAAEFAGHFQDVYEITGQLSLSAGLRYSQYLFLGPASINLYESGEFIDISTFDSTRHFDKNEIIKSYSGIEPRLSLRYSIGTSSSLKFGFSRNYQYLHILSNSTIIIPTDIWKSADSYIKPAIGDQISLGYFKNFSTKAIETSVEVYYKKVNNILEFKDGAVLVMNGSIEQDVLSADMNAYGIELLVRKNGGRLTGWVSYSYSRSFLKTSGAVKKQLINNGEQYPSYYDKPNNISIVATYKISRRFSLGSSFTYSTGRPATYPEMSLPISGNPVVFYSDRNKYRLRDYHRLDLSLTWDTSLKRNKKYYSSWVLSVTNVYGRNNVYSTYYKKDVPTEKNNYKRYAFYEMSIIGTPIPSLTYSIRF
jgi:hypothetical protein